MEIERRYSTLVIRSSYKLRLVPETTSITILNSIIVILYVRILCVHMYCVQL